ncbi:MAG: zinc ABC transporter substrate-binding protein [Anaerolineales bacterium]|nr:zinc ABC transporter substrate-binding protein [Anaerolineales bacterium]
MNKTKFVRRMILLVVIFVLAGCTAASETPAAHEDETAAGLLSLPEITAVTLANRPLRVVATTSLIGDVVGHIGGEAIALTVLMDGGQDPHSYEPSAGDLTAVADADVVFVNGWNLEEGLVGDLATIAEGAPLVPISAGIEPLEFGSAGHDHEEEEDDEHEAHAGADPHVWFAVQHVQQWAQNTAAVLGGLDPANEATYQTNLTSYLAELETLGEELAAQMATIPAEKRKLVTNHDALGYLAATYDLELVGTVIPGASTLAEPAASDLAELVQAMTDEGVCTIFSESTVSSQLADTVAAELAHCESVTVLPLFTGALGPQGSGAETYSGFMRTNVATIVQGLGQ